MVKSTKINEEFVCLNCGFKNTPHVSSCRNHCARCLYSRHVDADVPGDRASQCGGLMRPVALENKGGREILVHRCAQCGRIQRNKVAPDDARAALENIAQSTNPRTKY